MKIDLLTVRLATTEGRINSIMDLLVEDLVVDTTRVDPTLGDTVHLVTLTVLLAIATVDMDRQRSNMEHTLMIQTITVQRKAKNLVVGTHTGMKNLAVVMIIQVRYRSKMP